MRLHLTTAMYAELRTYLFGAPKRSRSFGSTTSAATQRPTLTRPSSGFGCSTPTTTCIAIGTESNSPSTYARR